MENIDKVFEDDEEFDICTSSNLSDISDSFTVSESSYSINSIMSNDEKDKVPYVKRSLT